MSRVLTTNQKIDHCLSIRQIQNTVGKVVSKEMLAEFDGIVDAFWCTRDDICLGMNDGYFQGREAVSGYYHGMTEVTKAKTRVVMDVFREKIKGAAEEDMYGAGYVKGTDMNSPIIELAGDGKSAKAMWHYMAVDTGITEKGPLSVWHIGYICADLLPEGGEWKIWHLLKTDEIIHPCAEPWTEPSRYEDKPEYAEVKNIVWPKPNVQKTVHQAYTPDRPFAELPSMPVPYETFAETFSYGI